MPSWTADRTMRITSSMSKPGVPTRSASTFKAVAASRIPRSTTWNSSSSLAIVIRRNRNLLSIMRILPGSGSLSCPAIQWTSHLTNNPTSLTPSTRNFHKAEAGRPAAGQCARLSVGAPLDRSVMQRGINLRSKDFTDPAPSPSEERATARLPQLESTRLYRRIAELLETRIDQGLFPAGTFLPPERELAEQLAVSRTSVREALIALEVTGRVAIRQGHGVQVLLGAQRPAAQNPSDADIGPIQIMEARRVIEPRIAELAATNHRQENLDGMRAAMDLQASATSASSENY